ncbi:MAG: sulfite exporter TauE/SafE family protein [Oscillochloris sp.]|nr:sulfite exporter TauE/SafE family protein [Oscillochloris sp.]
MFSIIIELVLGFLIGLSLGLLGGGGSILTVPVLVYIVGKAPHEAVTISLVIVGLNSLSGVGFHARGGTLNFRTALIFGSVGMLTAFCAASLSKAIPEAVLMVMFAGLMLVVGAMMLLRRSKPASDVSRRHGGLAVTLASGAGVGILTGFLGVGGGFLIVPALVILVGLPMAQAVGTSLVVIAMNCFAGLLGHLGGPPLDIDLLLIFGIAGVTGTYSGSLLARRIQPARLQQSFAVFVIVLALVLLADNLSKAFA